MQVAPVMNEDNGVAMEELEELNEKARNLHRIQIQMKLDVTRRQGELQELIRRVSVNYLLEIPSHQIEFNMRLRNKLDIRLRNKLCVK